MRLGAVKIGKNLQAGCLWKRGTAIGLVIVFTLFDIAHDAPQGYAYTPASVAAAPDPFSIPIELGKTEESFQGTCDKTLLFIQDAHDSLEAQEKIAKIIGTLVREKGIKTIFEEGYEGPVPTDKFFGFIKDPNLKQKVSYFLMDKLRIGGAEYAHINRTDAFKLIGVEDLKLYGENIQSYREASRSRKETDEDLKELFTQVATLADQYFPKCLKTWLKTKEHYTDGKLPLLSYLRELGSFYRSTQSFAQKYPTLSLLLMASTAQDPELIKQLNALDSIRVFEEMLHLERDISELYLQTERDRRIFAYYQELSLLKRLNQIELTQPEYEAVKETRPKFETQKLTDFIVSLTHRSLVLSKEWEQHIEDAVRFYRVAQKRDETIDRHVVDFLRNKDESTAILVFGGFHASAIKEILRAHQISYRVITPAITTVDKKHEEDYRQLMSAGHYAFELPFLMAHANRPPSAFFEAATVGDGPVNRELRAIASSVEALGVHSATALIEQRLSNFNLAQKRQPDQKMGAVPVMGALKSEVPFKEAHRSEVRSEQEDQESIGEEKLFFNRVALKELTEFLLSKLANRTPGKKTLVMAIDGDSRVGKTSLSRALVVPATYKKYVMHVDDYHIVKPLKPSPDLIAYMQEFNSDEDPYMLEYWDFVKASDDLARIVQSGEYDLVVVEGLNALNVSLGNTADTYDIRVHMMADRRTRELFYKYEFPNELAQMKHYLEKYVQPRPAKGVRYDRVIDNSIPASTSLTASAQSIRDAYESYAKEFDGMNHRAQELFETGAWGEVAENTGKRLRLYRTGLDKVAQEIQQVLGDEILDLRLWSAMKRIYIAEFDDRYDIDMALTFFYSVMRRIFNNTSVSVEYKDDGVNQTLVQRKSISKIYSREGDSRKTLARIFHGLPFKFENLDRDLDLAARRVDSDLATRFGNSEYQSIELAGPVFYRNRQAYLVGRIQAQTSLPVIFALARSSGGIAIDAVLTDMDDINNLFSGTHSSFYVETKQYRNLVDFLHELLPMRSKAEFYSVIGFENPAKVEFIKEMRAGIAAYPQDVFEAGKGAGSMVVFSMPGSRHVFKVPRNGSLQRAEEDSSVTDQYQWVHEKDRVARMLDSMYFRNLRFPKKSFSTALLRELSLNASPNILLEGDEVVLRNVYEQRKVMPADAYLREPSIPDEEKQRVVRDLGQAIRDLAMSGLFVGNFNVANFGVTSHGKVVLYHYDDLRNISAIEFLDKAEEGRPLKNNAVVIEEVLRRQLVVSLGQFGAYFEQSQADLFRTVFWKQAQAKIQNQELPDVLPYPTERRLAGRSEMRNDTAEQVVIELYDHKETDFGISINSVPSGHWGMDMASRVLSWDGRALLPTTLIPKPYDRFADGILKQLDPGTGTNLNFPIDLPWSDHEKEFAQAGYMTYDLLPYSNLFYNDGFVAYKGETGKIYYKYGEAYETKSYSMFVVWEDGSATSETFRFKQIPGAEKDKVEVYREGESKPVSGGIKFAIFGQRFIHKGETIPLDQIADQFEDLFQIYRFPQLVDLSKQGFERYGRAMGIDELSRWRQTGRQEDKEYFLNVVRQGGYTEIALAGYLNEKHQDGAIIQRTEEGIRANFLTPFHYKEVPPSVSEALKPGDYFMERGKLHIRFLPFAYPEHVIGITQSGKVLSMIYLGDKFKGRGVKVQDLVASVRERYAEQNKDPLLELFLIANSKDAFRRRNGSVDQAVNGAYDKGTAALLFGRPRIAPAGAGPRSEVREIPGGDSSKPTGPFTFRSWLEERWHSFVFSSLTPQGIVLKDMLFNLWCVAGLGLIKGKAGIMAGLMTFWTWLVLKEVFWKTVRMDQDPQRLQNVPRFFEKNPQWTRVFIMPLSLMLVLVASGIAWPWVQNTPLREVWQFYVRLGLGVSVYQLVLNAWYYLSPLNHWRERNNYPKVRETKNRYKQLLGISQISFLFLVLSPVLALVDFLSTLFHETIHFMIAWSMTRRGLRGAIEDLKVDYVGFFVDCVEKVPFGIPQKAWSTIALSATFGNLSLALGAAVLAWQGIGGSVGKLFIRADLWYVAMQFLFLNSDYTEGLLMPWKGKVLMEFVRKRHLDLGETVHWRSVANGSVLWRTAKADYWLVNNEIAPVAAEVQGLEVSVFDEFAYRGEPYKLFLITKYPEDLIRQLMDSDYRKSVQSRSEIRGAQAEPPGNIALVVAADKEAAFAVAAQRFLRAARENGKNGKPVLLGVGTGDTLGGVLKAIVAQYKEDPSIDLSRVAILPQDEYVGLAGSDPQSYRYFVYHHLVKPLREIDPRRAIRDENFYSYDGMAKDPLAEIKRIQEIVRQHGGIRCQLIGGGPTHYAFLEKALPIRPGALDRSVAYFNDFVLGVASDRDLADQILQIAVHRRTVRRNLSQDEGLLRKALASRRLYVEKAGLPEETDLERKLAGELDEVGERSLREQSLTFFIPELTPEQNAKVRQLIANDPDASRIVLKPSSAYWGEFARVVDLTLGNTVPDNARFFPNYKEFPLQAFSHVGAVLDADEIVQVAYKPTMADAIKDMMTQSVTVGSHPMAVFRAHPKAIAVVTPEAARLIPEGIRSKAEMNYSRLIENEQAITTPRSELRRNTQDPNHYTHAVERVIRLLDDLGQDRTRKAGLYDLLDWQRRDGEQALRTVNEKIAAPAQIIIGHLDNHDFYPTHRQEIVDFFLSTRKHPPTFKWIIGRLLKNGLIAEDKAGNKVSQLFLADMAGKSYEWRKPGKLDPVSVVLQEFVTNGQTSEIRKKAQILLTSLDRLPVVSREDGNKSRSSREARKSLFSRSEMRAQRKNEIKNNLRNLDSFVRTMDRLRQELAEEGTGPGILARWLFEVTRDDAVLKQRIADFKGTLQDITQQNEPGSEWDFALKVIQNLGIGHIVMISPEVAPFSIAGGMAKVLEGLPQALVQAGSEVTLVTFLYEESQGKKHMSAEAILREGIEVGGKKVMLENTGRQVHVVLGPTVNVFSNHTESPAHTVTTEVYRAQNEGVTIYFLYHPELTNRLYPNASSSEQLKRSILLSRGSLEVMRQFDLYPDFILANDWMAAPTFAFLKTDPIPGDFDYRTDEHFYDPETGLIPKLGFVVHNLGRDYQARFYAIENGVDLWPLFRLQGQHYSGLSNREGEDPNHPSRLNLVRGGIFHAHFVLTVSQSYAREIQTLEKGNGLHEDFLNKGKVYGISNGIDRAALWSTYMELGGMDPKAVRPSKYVSELVKLKAFAKRVVQNRYRLEERDDAVLISMIGRIADQKGVQLLTEEAKNILDRDPRVQLLVAGPVADGDQSALDLRTAVRSLEAMPAYQGRVRGEFEFVAFREALRIYLASDLFLMPSKYEPGGLTQLESLAAGTAVVAHQVGGIADTLKQFDPKSGLGDAFFFQEFTGRAFLRAVALGISAIKDKGNRNVIVVQAAAAAHGWNDKVSSFFNMFRNESGVFAYDYPHLQDEKGELEKIIALPPDSAGNRKRSELREETPRSEIRSVTRTDASMSELRAQTVVPIGKGSAASFNNPAKKMVRNIRKGTQPAMVFVDAEDFPNLSAAQKREYFVALSNRALHVVVYNERGQIRDPELEALLKLDRVVRTGRDLDQTISNFSRKGVPSVHVSKSDKLLPSRSLVHQYRRRVAFFKEIGDKSGALATALLWAISGGENTRLIGVKEEDGFWTVEDALLDILQRTYDNNLVIAMAA